MTLDKDFDAMADACIAAAEHVKRTGSPELQAVMRILLFILAGETAERARLPAEASPHTNGNGQH